MPVLTVDLGNTFCKLVLWDTLRARAPLERGTISTALSGAGLGAAVRDWLDDRPPVDRVLLSAVGDPRAADGLVRSLSGGQVVRRPDPGLVVECSAPDRVGRDRLFAARAALELSSSAVVVDAGTAVTVDAVDARDGRPRFLGGAIAPGPALSALALRRAQLPEVEPRADVPALGRDTEPAIRSGILHGFRGAVRELVDRIAEEAGLDGGEPAPMVLTGGWAGLLDDALFAGRLVRRDPDLVHRGMLVADAGSRVRGARG